MGRRAVFRNHLLPISALITVLGLVPTILAFMFYRDGTAPPWYMQVIPDAGWNLWVRILAPLVLLTGLWYLVEQLWLRRRFHKLCDVPKRSELVKNMSSIEDIMNRLPKSFEARIEATEASFKSKR